MFGLGLFFGGAVTAAHAVPAAEQRQQQHGGQQQRHPEPRKIKFLIPRPDDHLKCRRLPVAADIGGAHLAGDPVQRHGVFALVQRLDLQRCGAAILGNFYRFDLHAPVPDILGAYLVELYLVGILVDGLVEGQAQLVAPQRLHVRDLGFCEFVAHVNGLAVLDGTAQLGHGQRQRFQSLAVHALGDLGADFQCCGKIGLFFLQFIPQRRCFTQHQLTVCRLCQCFKKLRFFGHQVDVGRHADLVADIAGQRAEQRHVGQHLPGIGHDHGRFTGGQRLVVALYLTVYGRDKLRCIHTALSLLDMCQCLVHQVFVRCGGQHAFGRPRRRVQHQLVILAHHRDELAHAAQHCVKVCWADAAAVIQRDDIADWVIGNAY